MLSFFYICFCCCSYYVCVTVLIYFLPLCIMGWAYMTVAVTLWASEIPGDSSEHYAEQLTAKRKVTQNNSTAFITAQHLLTQCRPNPPVKNVDTKQLRRLSRLYTPRLHASPARW